MPICRVRPILYSHSAGPTGLCSARSRGVKLPTYCMCPKCNRLREPWASRLIEESTPCLHLRTIKKSWNTMNRCLCRERGRLGGVTGSPLPTPWLLVGHHGFYCTSQRNPTLPARDIRIIANELTSAKELVQAVMEELRRAKNDAQGDDCGLAAKTKLDAETKKGFDCRLSPMLVVGPWPGCTTVSSGRAINLPRSESKMASIEPPHKSVLPILPAKSVSPAKSWGRAM